MTLTPVNGTLSDCYIETIHPLGMLNTGRLTLNCCHILFREIILTSKRNRLDRNCCFCISTAAVTDDFLEGFLIHPPNIHEPKNLPRNMKALDEKRSGIET